MVDSHRAYINLAHDAYRGASSLVESYCLSKPRVDWYGLLRRQSGGVGGSLSTIRSRGRGLASGGRACQGAKCLTWGQAEASARANIALARRLTNSSRLSIPRSRWMTSFLT
ncbi:hypothetical protein PYW08_013085 [Mythimna loreyi]|uniref:Uncharacterized protein n=1 Tax=Mythimna loreyi TaxID=667449 RepID=A0ACC2PZA7_9NEOP|nr:hypothetical protein PYW08_013085 [Mythimna loreyi]